jgi:hypothetical protein
VPEAALSQVVTRLPVYIDNNGSVYDFGNGPLEFRVMSGSMSLFTSQGSGVGSTSGSSTSLTLTATPASNPPCVGCSISGTGITAGTTVSAFNGTTSITLSAAMTVASSTALAWGAACPASAAGYRIMQLQPGQSGGDIPMYTYARICGAAQFSPGATVLPFAIGAH